MQLESNSGRLTSTLWQRQREAADCVLNAFAMGHTRQLVIMPCGSGKTHLAVHVAHEVTANSRSLTLLPTRELLNQTARVWHESGRPGLYLGVCCDPKTTEPTLDGILTMTNDPAYLAHAVRTADGPVNVFATYAALANQLRPAHRDHRMPRWDIAIIDEAHRTAGALGKPWGAIHDDDAIPARHRLYLTATPRIWDVVNGVASEPIASMDDSGIFGQVAYRYSLAEAIHEGVLADYRIAAPEIHHPELRAFLTASTKQGRTPQADAARVAAAQLALLRAREEHGIQRTVSFSRSIAQCEALAETLPQTAAALPGHHAEHLWASSIHSRLPRGERHRLVSYFAQDPEPPRAGSLAELRVLCNVRLCVEGVDFPRADSVLFADPQHSTINIFQAIGRALRIRPGMNKVSTLVIPVLFGPGQRAEDATFGSPYHLLHKVMITLRAYDEHYFWRLPNKARHLAVYTPDFAIRPARAAEIAPHLMLRIMEPEPDLWDAGLHAARDFHTANGHLAVPSNHITEDAFHLGCWLGYQRALKAAGHLADLRVVALAALGMAWDHPADSTEAFLDTAQSYARQHRHLLPRDPQETYQGRPLAQWLLEQRRRDDEGTLPRPYQRALLDIDRWWNPHWPDEWQRTLIQVRNATPRPAIHAGPLDRHASHITQWLDRQFDLFPSLSKPQRQQLSALPFKDSPLSLALQRVPTNRFARGLRTARHYYRHHGHLRVPRNHKAVDGDRKFPLGQWIEDLRAEFHRRRLKEQEIAALNALAMEWDHPSEMPAPADRPQGEAASSSSTAMDHPEAELLSAVAGELPPVLWLAGRALPPALKPLMHQGGGQRALVELPARDGREIIVGQIVKERAATSLVLGPSAFALHHAARIWRHRHPTAAQAGLNMSLLRGSRLKDAADLADWVGEQETGAIVFANYNQAPLIVDSHRHHGLPAWEHLIIEEAHRTAEGVVSPQHAFADLHYDDRIIARRRYYLTGTSRIPRRMTQGIKARDVDWAVHMPAQQIFGHHVRAPEKPVRKPGSAVRTAQLHVCQIRMRSSQRQPWSAEADATAQLIATFQLRHVLIAMNDKRAAHDFAVQLAVHLHDATIRTEGNPVGYQRPGQPVIHCLRASHSTPPRNLDAVVLPDWRCSTVQLVDVLGSLLAQRAQHVPHTRVIVPYADAPTAHDVLGPHAPALIESATAALWAHQPRDTRAGRKQELLRDHHRVALDPRK
ncbi:Helicase associated domain protein [Streptomyces griseus]|uniref:Helicase associated domain protein n=1 Tax=Streptomyces griseus TaxID=1911 RepID=UPI0037B687AB